VSVKLQFEDKIKRVKQLPESYEALKDLVRATFD